MTTLAQAVTAFIMLLTAATAGAQEAVQMRKLQMAAYAMMDAYVDPVPGDTLVEAAIEAMLGKLDPHSTYMNADEVKRFEEQMSGKFYGIGITFNMLADTAVVIQTLPGSPAEEAGLLAGDKIIAVDSTALTGRRMDAGGVTSLIRGAEGSTVRLTVVRRGLDSPTDFDVRRGKVDVKSVDVATMLAPSTGYVRINNFGATTADEFVAAASDLAHRGMESLIIDLRGNGGGYLGSAVDIISEFIGRGKVVVSTVGRGGKRRDITARAGGRLRSPRVVVLVDDFTASAAEILSGNIQDYDRGLVIGRRTFGKGLVQNVLDLPDGSMIRLTTSRYYLPSGRLIQKPYKAGHSDDYANELLDRYRHGEMFAADSIDFPDSLRYTTLRLGRTVYGGGGVMPDIFVPLDTTRYNSLHRELMARGCLNRAVLTWLDTRRGQIAAGYDGERDFIDRFTDDGTLMQALTDDARAAGITPDSTLLAEARPLLALQLKGLAARDLWTTAAYVIITAPLDAVLQKALAVLRDGTYEEILDTKR